MQNRKCDLGFRLRSEVTLEKVTRIANGCQRIAEFVRKHREELILLTVGRLQFFFGFMPSCYIRDRGHPAVDRSIRLSPGRVGDVKPTHAAHAEGYRYFVF